MSALQTQLPGASVLDLFAGSGALGLEALSRGAARATFVERSGAAIRVLRSNIERAGATAEEAIVVRADAIAFARTLGPGDYDIALADPPYGSGLAATIAAIFAEKRFAKWLWIEHRAGEPVPEYPGARTRRYGDTALTSIPAKP